MSDSSAQSLSERETGGGAPPTKDELDELRHLLLEPEQTEIVKLQKRLDDPRFIVDDVSRVLPEAVAIRSSQDRQLTNALMPAVEDALTVSVKKDPQKLVDIIFPVLGPAIRKAISSALGEMVQSLNQTLEHSLSLESLRWRWEAYRTRRPFAEIVLYHKLVFQVEHVFLIHRQTGLQLLHVARKIFCAGHEIPPECAGSELVRSRRTAETQIDPVAIQRGQRSELLGDHERRVIRQHDAAGPDANRARAIRHVSDDDGSGRACDPAHSVMLGEPESQIAELLGVPGENTRIAERLRGRGPLGDRGEVEDGEWGHPRRVGDAPTDLTGTLASLSAARMGRDHGDEAVESKRNRANSALAPRRSVK